MVNFKEILKKWSVIYSILIINGPQPMSEFSHQLCVCDNSQDRTSRTLFYVKIQYTEAKAKTLMPQI